MINKTQHIIYLNLTIFICLILSLSATNALFSQNDKTKLQENKKKIEQEIKFTNQLLKETKKDKQNSLNQLFVLKNQINKREELITNINQEINVIVGEINYTQNSVEKLSNDLIKLKKEYARMIVAANKNRGANNILMFIFASENFNQAFQRVKYYRQYSSFRKTQAQLIIKKQSELSQKKQQLESQKTNQSQLLVNNEIEKKQLTKEQETKNVAVQQLQKTEKELLKTLRKKEAEARKLQKDIERIIAEEVRKAKEAAKLRAENKRKEEKANIKTGTKPELKVEKEEKSTKTTSEILTDTPEDMALSTSFASNRGRLPWPSEKGIISSSFGQHSHPELPGIVINNDGIDITTNRGAYCRSVFNGEVTAVISGPNGKDVIIIRHGNFLSVYSNLENVYVRRGEKVITKQKLGSISTNDDDDKTVLQFQIWKGNSKLNPMEWIAR
jgi:septal ring factor EnvC (AmiA/AmiB activator)